MALLFCDSFDHVNSYGAIVSKWGSGNVFIDPSTSFGRFGTKGMVIANNRYIALDPSHIGTPQTGIWGMAALSTTTQMSYFLGFYDVTGGAYHVTLYHNSDGAIIAYRGRGSAELGRTAAATLKPNRFYYLEAKVKIHDTIGTVEVRLDGTTVLNLTGQDTKNSANAYFNTIYVGDGTASQFGEYLYFDDVYLCDDSGSTNNNFLGDVRVECLFPNGNGNASQLVGQDADSTNNYLNVDETTDHDGDTTYNESSTVGNKDTYAYTNLTPSSGTVFGVQVTTVAKKTDAGTRKICSVARLSGTEVDSADRTLSASYIYQHDIRETKPGGGAWTISDVNSAEFGVKVTA